jgi:D-lyxose ketol-isomerase
MAISRAEYEAARDRALEYYRRAATAITAVERDTLEVADFGLGELQQIGVELVMYVNTERVCAKEVVLFPGQICPQHRHPAVGGQPGKEETFRCRWGKVFLYVEGPATENPRAVVPVHRRPHFTVWHEIVLEPGDQHTVPPDTLHWFQGGPDGAVLSEFSTPSTDALDVFTDPDISRQPVIYPGSESQIESGDAHALAERD